MLLDISKNVPINIIGPRSLNTYYRPADPNEEVYLSVVKEMEVGDSVFFKHYEHDYKNIPNYIRKKEFPNPEEEAFAFCHIMKSYGFRYASRKIYDYDEYIDDSTYVHVSRHKIQENVRRYYRYTGKRVWRIG